MLYLEIIHNIALLVCLVVIHGQIIRRWDRESFSYRFLSGLLFGGVALVGMMTPVPFLPGLFFDGRSIILSVAGLFGGPITAGVAAIMSAFYRLWVGGTGVVMGVSVILESAGLGVAFYYLRRRYPAITGNVYLLGFGLLVHAVMMLLTLTLPTEAMIKALKYITGPVMLIYPPATWLICRLFLDQESRISSEEALRDSEERYRAVFDNAAIGIDTLDRDGRIVRVNPALSHMLGYTEDELKGLTFAEITHPDDREVSKQNLESLMKVEIDSYRLEKRYQKKDGDIVWGELSTSSIRDANGYQTGFVGVIANITDRKRAEEGQRRSEERLELALKGADLGWWDLDLTTGQGVVNQRMLEIIGYSPGEVETSLHVWQQFIHPDDIEFVREDLKEHFEGRTDFVDHEYRIRNKSGQDVYILARGRIVQRGEDGKPLRLAGTVMDVTERKRAAEELREGQEKYRNLVESISDVIFEIDTGGVLTYISPVVRNLFGYEPEDLIGKRFLEFVYPEDTDLLIKRFSELTEGVDYPSEYRLVGKSGEVRNVRTYTRPIMKENVFQGARGTLIDITERIQSEQERENLRSQLLQSQKMEAVGTLAAGIAHDFNNMLQVILGYSDMLLSEKRSGEPGYAELQKVVKTSIEARDLVQKIRLFSRKADIQPVAVDLNHQLRELTKLLTHTLLKTIDVNVHLGENLDLIKADPGLMDQMVTNLAINAAEAMPDGGTLTIGTQNIRLDEDFCSSHIGAKPGPHVLLTISDSGRGMTEELLDRIFDPFFSTKQRDYHRGTGLGLSIVKGIVDEHEGYMTVESEVGRGTTFKIYFPILTAQEIPKIEPQADIPTEGGETVLLVEDEELVRDLGIRLLESFGYTVIAVCDGQEAVEAYAKHQGNIALVILDIVMPRMDGRECLQELLKMNPAVKVLISSGVAQEDRVKEVVDLGARGALLKPYGMKVLQEKVRDILGSQ